MKKRILALVLALVVLTLCLTACAKEPKPDVSMLEYPGLKWGMTTEEVKEALNLSDDQMSIKDERGSPCLTAQNLTLFGYPLKGVKFYFSSTNDGPYANGLSSITAYFTEETDMTQVRDAMIQIYGDGDTWSGQNYQLSPSGELVDYVEVAKNPNRLQHYWTVSGKLGDVIEDMEQVNSFFENAYSTASKETIAQYLELVQLVRIGLVDTAATDGQNIDSTVATKNVVQFNGTGIMWFMQNFG